MLASTSLRVERRTSSTTLHAVEAYAPERRVTVEEAAERLWLNRHQTRLFRRVHGLDVLREDATQSLLELITTPAAALVRAIPDPDDIRYLIFAHTIQSVAPSYLDIATLAARQLGLRRANAFALTQQNCATGLAAVDLAGELLRADNDPRLRALVITGEKTFSRIAQLVENTSIIQIGNNQTNVIDGFEHGYRGGPPPPPIRSCRTL